MKRFQTVIVAAFACLMAAYSTPAENAQKVRPHIWLGADISGTTFDESRGQFSTDTLGVVTENTRLMKQYGMDAVRLRVWVNPRGGWSSPEDVLEMAKRAKQEGMAVMIDFHYSDWWADPEKQPTPAAWADLSLPEMEKALAGHTRSTLQLLKDNDIDVKWVQVGNETRNGFLWPTAKFEVGGDMSGMKAYAALSNAGYDAVKEVYPEAAVIVHIDNGFDNPTYNTIFDALKENGGKFDIIGMSVYPYWAIKYDHEPDAESTLRDAVANIRALNKKYGCEVMIVEAGVDSSQPAEGLAFMNSLFDAVINDTDGACTGVFYWAPEAFQVVGPDGKLHGYSLGAFEAPGRPTDILKSYSRAASILSRD